MIDIKKIDFYNTKETKEFVLDILIENVKLRAEAEANYGLFVNCLKELEEAKARIEAAEKRYTACVVMDEFEAEIECDNDE